MLHLLPPLDPKQERDEFTIEHHPPRDPFMQEPYDGAEQPHFRWELITQGKCVEVKRRGGPSPFPPNDKPRIIKEFTRSSRMRMLKVSAKIDWKRIGRATLLTLTYPDRCLNLDAQTRAYHRTRMMREIEKHLGRQVAALWRVEWEKRRSGRYKGQPHPHHHILLFSCPFVHYGFINDTWRRIIGTESYCRTEIRRAKNHRKAAYYVAKYCAKVQGNLSLVNALQHNSIGRSWGVLRKDLIPFCVVRVQYSLDEETVACLQRVAEGVLADYNPHTDFSFTLLGDAAERFSDSIWEFGLDVESPEWYVDLVRGGD